jgi:hypothetical protein
VKIHVVIAALVLSGLWAAGQVSAGELVLADKGKSSYKIVVADDASPSTKHAAEELQKFLQEMTGAKLSIVSDKKPMAPREIILGDNAHFKSLKTDIDVASLGKEGYVIRTVGNHLVIVGGALRGNLYGVYGLLEDHLGCHWFTPDCSRIPKSSKLAIDAIDDRQIPALEYREVHLADCFDVEWCAHNRLNSNSAGLEEKHGGKVKFGDGYMVHTFNGLVPPDKYYAEHPEYFSLVDGKRLKDRTQLCCTNPDVIRICTERILQAMREQPGATVFSVSQNDWGNQCRCPECQALAEQEETQMAPVLQLVNKVAEAAEKEFPDKIVETLAYTWTRKAPKTMRPRPNVVIWLCSIECCFAHPLETCDSRQNKAFRADIEAWAKVANRLWVWNYNTDFWAYLLPFPNQRVRGPNIRFYTEHHVTGIFEQDNSQCKDSELASLGGYITAKCLWNPNYDTNKAMNEFLEGYYGKAAEPIRKYIDLIHDYVEKENIHVGIYVPVDHRHLTDELLIEADKMWQQAENAVAKDATLLHRVKVGRLSVDYAIMERNRPYCLGKRKINEDYQALVKARFAPFCENLKASEVTRVHEIQDFNRDAYIQKLAKDLKIEQ